MASDSLFMWGLRPHTPDWSMLVSVPADRRFCELDDGFAAESSLSGFARTVFEKCKRVRGLDCAAPVGRCLGDKRSQSLTPVDDAFALELFVRALHRDHADEQLLGQPPE